MLELAVVHSSNGADELTVNRTLAKAKAIGEILDYVNGNEQSHEWSDGNTCY